MRAGKDVYTTIWIERATSKEMREAKHQEIKNFLDRGTFKVVLRGKIPKDANVLPRTLVLALKYTEDGEINGYQVTIRWGVERVKDIGKKNDA